tara:strand:+ start:204 stop:404 length:201 start_codon:yes stop_codon:yes gene_type:complete
MMNLILKPSQENPLKKREIKTVDKEIEGVGPNKMTVIKSEIKEWSFYKISFPSMENLIPWFKKPNP